jgi:hypothetical protein
MGLWLKCPQCQAANPLENTSCLACDASLTNLPAAQRVYILGKAVPAAPKAAAPPAAPAAPNPAAPAGVSPEVNASAKPPAKGAKARKPRKKKS